MTNASSEVSAAKALRIWWRDTGDTSLLPKDAQSRVEALETRCGVALPDDFRRYLLETAPSQELWDHGDCNWWPIERIRSIPEEYEYRLDCPEIAAEADQYLFFADYLIWCWAWAICCSPGPNRGRVVIIGNPVRFVADSFSSFVERHMADRDFVRFPS